jgi:hypothetical protein
MTRLEKRIAFDMGLFYLTIIVFWISYQDEYNVMDKFWKIVMCYMISSSASIYSVIVTNKYLKDFCILVSLLRFTIMFVYIAEAFIGFDPNVKGPHLCFITISTVISFFLSKSKLILRIRRLMDWLNLG